MTEKPDAQLLRKFAEDRDDDAFRDIVNRYADLVYSAALRQVESPDLAADVAQSVFLDLARKAREVAGNMGNHSSLVGWLYRGTRFAALKHLRDAHRRAAQERQAMEQLLTNAESSPDWNDVRPILDEAMAGLNEDDREAILLRYFQNRDFRAVGAALGVSDDTAQKRVSRAVDRLRELFAKRGVAVGAGGLAIALTANAVQAAPIGLSISISTTALTGTSFASAIATSTAVKAVAMTTLQKTAIATVFAIVAGAGLYQARQTARLHQQNDALLQRQSELAAQIQGLQDDTNALAARLAALVQGPPSQANVSDELLKLRAETSRLRDERDAALSLAKTAGDSKSQFAQLFSNLPPIVTYLSTSSTEVSWNQAILTGGWKTPDGKRTIVVTTTDPGPDGKQVVIHSRIINYSDDAGAALGLDQYNTDGQMTSKAYVVNRDDLTPMLNSLDQTPGAQLLSSPVAITQNGQQAQVSVGNQEQTASGQKYMTGASVGYTPTIASDGQSVRMMIIANLNYPIQKPAN